MQLAGKTALVTGSAHRLGRAIALALASRGCDLMVHYHRAEEQAAHTVAQARRLGVRAVPMRADLTSVSEIVSMFRSVDEELGGLDILVNSAAVLQRHEILQVSDEDWENTIRLNLKAPFFCTQQAARRMQTRNGGAIVNVSDLAALRPWPRFPVHSISKAGLEMLTKVSALALAPDIRVNAVAPGPVLKPVGMAEGRWQEIGSSVPLGRPGSPQDVVEAVVFLIEDDYVTGETLTVDGGASLA